MDELKKPYAVIRFDESTGQLKRPTFLLKTRTGHIIGKLNYTSLNMSLVGKGVDEITFEVHKTVNGIECPFWDKIRDLGIVEFVEYDHSQFEADIRTDDEVDTIKYFTLKSLECELGQKKLYEFHVNDEDAIIYSTENPFIPTVLYNASDPEHSLIHRALKEKAPHWNVGEVSPYFNINGQVYSCDNLQREYTIDGTTIYDFFEGDVSEESCCVFTYNTKDRLVNCYNLEPCVFLKSNMQAQNGYTYIDGIFYDEAGNELDSNLYGWCDGIGEDTNIILSKTKLSRSFTRDSDAGSIKNCFRVTGGDDIITNTVGAANVTGNNYIYMFGNFQYEDMGEELTNLIKEYQTFYETEQKNFIKNGGVYIYHPEYIYDSTYDVCKDENGHILPDAEHIGNKVYVVDPCAYFKDNKCFSRDDVQLSSSNAYYKEPGMYTDYCHTLDRLAYLEHNKFPNTDVLFKTSASQQRDILQSYFGSNPVLVKYGYNPETDSDFRSITSTVETMLKLECDPRYTVSIIEDRDHVTTCTKVDENTQGIWSGTIRIVRDTDAKDKVDDFNLSITVKYVNSEDNLDYCKQKVLIAINKLDLKELGFTKTSTNPSSIGVITVITDNELRDLLNQYNLTTLKTFRDGFSSCRSTLDDLYNNLEIDAYKRDENGDIIRDENGNPIETDIISESLLVSRDAYTRRYQIACEIYDKRQTQVDEWTSLEQSQNANLIEYKKSMSLQYYFIYELLPNDIKSNIKYKDYGYPESNTSYYSSIAVGDLYLDIENGVVYKVKSISSTNIIWEEHYTSSGYQCWLDYNKYVREDEYNNGNYISDGLSDSEILLKAKELLEVANAELSKACNIQYKISGSLNNIFAENELKKLYSKFALFNYVRAKVDDQIYKLRLIEIRFNEDSPDQLEVVFSEQIEDVTGKLNDTASILAQSQSMSTTYSSTAKQAKQGVSAYRTFDNIRQEGMDSSLYLIKNSPEQLMTFERNGLLGRSMFDEGIYSPEQSIFTSNGLYFTRNGFESIETALGKFKYNNKWVYGLNAEYVIGKFMVGENLLITNENGSVNITGDGIELDGGSITWKTKLPQSSVTDLVDDLAEITSELSELDDRIETFSQTTDPSADWTTTELKEKHLSDLWFNPTDGLTKRWTKSGTTYKWETVTDSDLVALAQSKATVFVSKPTSGYRAKDLWILEKDNSDGSDTTYPSYKMGSVLVASTTSSTYNTESKNHWKEDVRYTDDTTANQALADARQGIADAAGALARANAVDTAAQGYANTAESNAKNASDPRGSASSAESNAKTYADNKDSALSTALTSAYQNYVSSAVGNLDHAVADYLNLSGATSIYTAEYAISPYIGGGYVNVSKGSGRVIIDPSNQAGTGYILAGMKTSGTDQGIKFGIDSNGNAVFTGAITATSLTLGTGVTIGASKVSGLSTVATSGNASDLNGISNYVTNSGLSNTLESYVTSTGLATELSDLSSNSNINTILNSYATITSVQDALSEYAKSTDLPPTVSITKSTSSGITTTNIKIDNNTYTTYSASTSDGCMVYGFSKGSQSTDHDTNYFKVSTTGLLEADNAVIHGKIWASEGEFAGELKAATGEFSGKITASSGSIGGWDINDYYLTKNDQTWSIFQTVGMTMYSLTANASATLKPAYSENSIGSSGQLIFNTSYEYKKSGTKVGEAGYESTLTNASLIFTGHSNYDWINKESTPDFDYTAKYTSNEVEFTSWNGNIVSYTANGISCQGTSILDIPGQTIPCLRNCYIDSGSVSAANLFSTSKAEFSGLDDYCQLRISCGSTGVMLRNDGNDFYFLVGETSGGWNNLRPFHFNLSTGNVTMENNVYVTNSNEAQYNLINTSVNRTGRLVMTSTQGGRFGLYVDGTGWIVRNDAYTSNIVYFDNYINSQRCVDASTTATPNCYIDIDGTFLRTSGSSKRYKKDIKTNIPDEIKPERLYDINVYSYKFRKDYLKNENDIRYQKDVVGFIAEDILEKYPIAAEYHKDKNGELIVDDWNDRYIIPPMLKLIQDQKQEIDELKKQINEIKDLLMSR